MIYLAALVFMSFIIMVIIAVYNREESKPPPGFMLAVIGFTVSSLALAYTTLTY